MQNILSAFKSCGISPFDPSYFFSTCPLPDQKALPSPPLECFASPVAPPSSQHCGSPASPATVCNSPISRSNSTKSDAWVQCTAKEIHQVTKNDPWNLRLDGFVTSETMIEAASHAKEPKQKQNAHRKGNLETGSVEMPAQRQSESQKQHQK